MKRKYDHFQEDLEWEILDPESEITNLSLEKGLYNLKKDCVIKFSRDNQYGIIASISGILENEDKLQPNIKRIKGAFVPDETIIGFSRNGMYKYKLYGIHLGASTFGILSSSDSSIKFNADLIVNRIERTFNKYENEIQNIQEWYLAGYANVNFVRSTSRSVEKTFKRVRTGIDNEEEFRLSQSSGIAKDYILVKFADTSFIVSKVPDGFGPDWSNNIAIEYRQSFGRIPDDEEREAISEIVSFAFGTQFLKVGETSYDSSNNLVLQEHQNPWGDNVLSVCQRQGLPPVEIGNFHDWGRVEILLNELVPNYLIQRKELRLKDAIWKYWLARHSPLGTNLPVLASAIETLADRVLKAHPSFKHYYIEFNKFAELIKEELKTIEEKLENIEQKGIILNKIKGASQRGSNEKLEMMFEIIKLPIGKIERQAIKARNKMAHSSFGEINDEEIKETMRMTRAYETLFNRILLKILSYSGQYIDYYTFSHPNRNIDEFIPE